MNDNGDFTEFESSRAIGKVDAEKPAKPQIIERIKDHLDSESKRGKRILADQIAEMDRLRKHLEKFNAAMLT